VVECVKHGMTRDRPSRPPFVGSISLDRGILQDRSDLHTPSDWTSLWKSGLRFQSGKWSSETQPPAHGINRSTGGHEYWQASGEIL